MNRLITFGCSHTFGHGLPDCIEKGGLPGLYPSKMAWPSVISDLLQLQLVNLAMPGCSNFAILDKIINFKFTSTDTVIVLWSYFERDMIFRPNGQRFHFRLNNARKLLGRQPIDYYLDIHNETDIKMRSWYYMHHAYLFLNSFIQNITFLHVNYDIGFMELRPDFSNNICFPKVFFDDYLKIEPKALDNLHGGVNCHRQFAHDLYKEVFATKN